MNSCDTYPWDEVDKRGLTVFLVCAPFTIIFNSIVLAIALNHIKLKERLDQWFVVNMTAANLVYGIVYLFVAPYVYNLPRLLCILYYVIGWTCTATSMLLLLLLNIHKCITLFLPLKSLVLISNRKTAIQILLAWMLSLIYSVMLASKLSFNSDDPCYECRVEPQPFMYATMIIMFFICPLSISYIISACIFALAQSKIRNPTGSIIPGERRKTLKRIFFVFSYTIFSVITFLPYRIYHSIYILCFTENVFTHLEIISSVSPKFLDPVQLIGQLEEETTNDNHKWCLNNRLLYGLSCLLPFGCMINPLITIITQRCYRNAMKKWFRGFLNCITCDSTTN